MTTGPSSVVLVVSEGGCRSSRGGSAIAEELDRTGTEWVEVASTAGDAGVGGDLTRALDALADAGTLTLTVVVVGAVVDDAVEVLARDPRVALVVVVCTDPGPHTVWLLEQWHNVPVIAVADTSTPETLRPAVRAYRASRHPDADIEVVTSTDIDGITFGDDDSWSAVSRRVVSKIGSITASAGLHRDVCMTTDDGWQIHGTLTVPVRDHPVPAAILLHSGRSDRAVFARLVGLLTRRGVATLNLDWRGRGRSQNVASYFELSSAQRAEGWRDAATALDSLESEPLIDASRTAMVGVVHGAEHAVAASIGDRRVRMLGILTGYVPRSDAEREHLISGDVDVWYVSCSGHGPVTGKMRELVESTPAGRASLRVYPGGAIGYQLFSIDPRLEDEIARWVAEGLGADSATGDATDRGSRP